MICALLLLALTLDFAADRPATGETVPLRIGLALSGGGAMGLSHIGVIKVLEEESIPFCYVSGSSMGSIVGGMAACGFSGVQMESIARVTNWIELFNDQVPLSAMNLEERETHARYLVNLPYHNFLPRLPTGVLEAENVYLYFKEMSERYCINARGNFDSLVIPYRAIAVDFLTGEVVTIREGSLADAMRASMAIPGIFSPHYQDGRVLVDGGVVKFLPVDPLHEFNPDFIIAADVRQPRDSNMVPSLIDIIWLSVDIATEQEHQVQLAQADVVINPDLTGLTVSDFGRAAEMIVAGESAARRALPELRRKLAGRPMARIRHELHEQPMPVVRGVTIEGLRVTNRRVVRREIRTRKDAPLNLDRLYDDLRAVYNTGLFTQVTYQLKPVGADTVTVAIHVREKDFGVYSLGLRYDQANQFLFGAEIAQENIRGSGSGVGAGLVLGNPRAGWLLFGGNRFFGLPANYQLRGFLSSYDQRYRLYDTAATGARLSHRNLLYGGSLKLGFNLGRNSYLKGGLDLRQVNYDLVAGDLRADSAEYLVAGLGDFRYKDYTDLVFPHHGLSFRLLARYGLKPLGSQYSYFRGELQVMRPFAAGSRVVIEPTFAAGGLLSGRFQPIALESLPAAERFIAGGPEIAGAAFEQFGSARKLVLGLNLKILIARLLNSSSYPLYVDLQGDAATFTRWQQVIPADLYYGGYAGISLGTPVGPIKIGYGLGRGGPSQFYLSAGFELAPDFTR